METSWLAALAPHQKQPWKLKELLVDEAARPKRQKQSWQQMKDLLRLALN